MSNMKTFVVALSKVIRVRVIAETSSEAMRAALGADDRGEHLMQWVDMPTLAESLGEENRKLTGEDWEMVVPRGRN